MLVIEYWCDARHLKESINVLHVNAFLENIPYNLACKEKLTLILCFVTLNLCPPYKQADHCLAGYSRSTHACMDFS